MRFFRPQNRKVYCISYPRSGHHILVRCLRHYFGGAVRYCETYNHCQTLPCTDPGTNLQKHHDTQLDLPQDPARYYLVQYRHPVDAIVSFFEFSAIRKWHGVHEDTESAWKDFADKAVLYWQKFVRKWLLSEGMQLRCHGLAYEDWMRDPAGLLKDVIRFINPKISIRENRIQEGVRMFEVSPQRRTESFRYFDPAFFGQLEQRVGLEIKQLGLPFRWASVGSKGAACPSAGHQVRQSVPDF